MFRSSGSPTPLPMRELVTITRPLLGKGKEYVGWDGVVAEWLPRAGVSKTGLRFGLFGIDVANPGGPEGSYRRVEFPLGCLCVRPRPEALAPRDPGAAPGAVPHVPEYTPNPAQFPPGSANRYFTEQSLQRHDWPRWNQNNRDAEARGSGPPAPGFVLRARGDYTLMRGAAPARRGRSEGGLGYRRRLGRGQSGRLCRGRRGLPPPPPQRRRSRMIQ